MNTSIDRKRTMEAASNNTWESKTATKRALPRPTPKFTVTYSRLCDGGAQEMSTAVCCVREIFPDSSIATHRRTSEEDVALGTPNPEVIIVEDTTNRKLWSSKQRNLYQKYPKKRKKSMKEIRKALEAFKTSLKRGVAEVVPTIGSSSSSHTVTSQTSQSSKTQSQTPPQTSQTRAVPTSVANEVSEDFTTAVPAPSEDACEDGTCCIYQPLR